MTTTKPVSIGMRGEDVDVWFDLYVGRRSPPPVVMVHNDFVRMVKESRPGHETQVIGNVVGAWSHDGQTLRLFAGGRDYIYRRTGWVTAGGFTEYGWPD